GGVFGIIDKTGNQTTGIRYAEISYIAEGVYKVVTSAGLVGLIDANDKPLMPAQYEELGDFSL
ncbi:MAG: WG repeat-containing protein, partial [Bacteroidetes bacterium]|nr:WG repeat-containing protein [Bacteroidota bacterium]